MSSSAPVPPAPEIILAEAAKDAPRPPYVAVPSITNPKLTTIPDVDRFLVLCDGEKVVKSWRVRVRRPKFPWWLFFASFLPIPMVLLAFYESYSREVRRYRNNSEYQTDRTSMFDDKSAMPRIKPSDDGSRPDDFSQPRDYDPSVPPSRFETAPYAPEFPDSTPPSEIPRTGPGEFPESFKLLRAVPEPGEFSVAATGGSALVPRAPPALLGQIPSGPPKPRAPSYFSPALFFVLLFWLTPAMLMLLWFFVFARRGHTFLYLTNRRVIAVELEQNALSRYQTVLNYTLENVAGFTLFAQRGLKKLFWLILLKEKRTFYMAIVTRTLAQFELGAINTFRSRYEPGLDAVAVCAELDALVLGLKAGRPPK